MLTITMNPNFIYWLMFSGALVITLFSVISAKEQSDRLKNSGYGTLASGAISIIITLSTKGNIELLAYSFTGSAFGALIGWLIIYFIVKNATKQNSLSSLSLIELLYTGLSGVKTEFERNIKNKMRDALNKWNLDFETTINNQIRHKDGQFEYEKTIHCWLKITCDLYQIVFSVFGRDSSNSLDKWQIRASLIVFGKNKLEKIEGFHWISYSGERPNFKINKPFEEDSDAFKVITNQFSTPHKFPDINSTSQNRKEENRTVGYQSYMIFKVNDYSAITIDWPIEISEDDEFLKILKSLIHISVCPKIAELISTKKLEILSNFKLESL